MKDMFTRKSIKTGRPLSERTPDKQVVIEGKAWVIGRDNIDTDMIFHNSHLATTDIKEMGQYTFGNLDGYEKFAENAGPGDIVIAGENFGCGSSREHPSVGLSCAGISAIIVKSVNRIFYRSSINQGLILIVSKEAVGAYEQGDPVKVSLERGEITVGSAIFRFQPLPEKLKQILEMKGLVNYLKSV